MYWINLLLLLIIIVKNWRLYLQKTFINIIIIAVII